MLFVAQSARKVTEEPKAGKPLSDSVRDGAGTGLARTYSACLEAPRLLDQGGALG
jgi:hypothetical protein